MSSAPLELRLRADRLFEELAEMPATERNERLGALRDPEPEVVRLVERLLTALDAEDGAIDRAAAEARERDPLGAAAAAGDEIESGARFGAWQVIAPLGRGGMSRVYVAERVDGGFRQRAALKLFEAPSGDAAALAQRFEQERQILAALEHPNIARVLDGGVAGDGRPFLVLELVDGVPIDAFCAARDLALGDRLRLFVSVARAVQHAHRNLVVHRDLKPSNLLVTGEGTVKLLDFGIAKVLSGSAALAGLPLRAPETRTWARPLTPAYASPEQVRGGAITTASDVYQLGLLLYEILAGRPAHLFREDSWRELDRVVCETDPPRFSLRSPVSPPTDTSPLRVPADLETIVFKALAKEPSRRYGSAEQLAEDLERFLADKPVLARPDTIVYRARKFARRHRFAVAAAVALAVALAAGAAATLWQAREAAKQRDAARSAAERSERSLGFLLDVFEAADDGGGAITARDLVARSAERLRQGGTTGKPRAEMLAILARADSGLGLHGEAAALRAELAEIVRREQGDDSLELARTLDELGNTLVQAGNYSAAIASLEEALRIQKRRLGEEHPETATTSSHLSYALGVKGDARRSLALREQVLAMRRRLHGPEHPEVAQALNDVGRSLRFLGRLEEAERHLQDAVALRRRLDGDDTATAGVPLSNLAMVLVDRGALSEADAAATEALALAQRRLRPGHPSLAGRIQLLGTVRLAEGRLAEAAERFESALALYRSSLPPGHFSIAECELALAEARLLAGRREAAEALAASAHGRLLEEFPQDGFRAGQAAALLGAARAANGGGSTALALAEEGYAGVVAELGEASPVAQRARRFVERARAAAASASR
jgi:serine/threonine-protein kinase